MKDQERPLNNTKIISIEDEMRSSYLDYAMSVIVSRALPDVRDGLKPVHRRILYTMDENGFDYNKPFRKCAGTVGDVIRKYHPHGDQAIYDALVRLAQNFSLREMLIDGQGNFGSIDGDPAAAYRYTEARLAKISRFLLDDIDKGTVDFQPNFDNSTKEPMVLPARFPNLLVNGAGGIAVGMATNIPPHNLGEVLTACAAYLDNPDITTEELMEIVPGPDFPTGAQIVGRHGIREAYATGRGSIMMRGVSSVEEFGNNREAIIITEIPYQVNKARMIERIAELVNAKQIEGISDLRDESDRDGIRVVVELKRDADASVVLNLLHKHTPLQTSFGANMLALVQGRPETLGLKRILVEFVAFRQEVITRRTHHLLDKAQSKAHVGIGLAVAVANLDDVIVLIRRAPDPQTAREQLMERWWNADDILPLVKVVDDPQYADIAKGYKFSEAQARAILELRLHRLTGLERDKIAADLNALAEEIKGYIEILSSRERLYEIMRAEFEEIKAEFATPRRSEIIEGALTSDIEDLIQREDMVVTVSHNGYVKRVPLSTYREQRRGGKGRSGMATRDEDFVNKVFVATTHTHVLFFTDQGMSYHLKVYRLPLGTPQARGQAIINILPLSKGERVTAILPLDEDQTLWENREIVFATASGSVRRNRMSDFANIKSNGKIAMKLDEGDRLIGVSLCDENDDVFLSTYQGKCIRFHVNDVRIFSGRTSTGVRGVRLAAKDHLISLMTLPHVDATSEERGAYLRMASKLRRGDDTGDEGDSPESTSTDYVLSEERFKELQIREKFVLVVSEKGMGKRSSAYEYRVSGRGGMGIANIDVTSKTGPVASSFVVDRDDQLMLVTNNGQLIRCGLHAVRIVGRKSQGVSLLRVKADEKVVSASLVAESDEDDDSSDSSGDAS
ncbi:MAG: DNA gyrase subunit A [Alphaproteobacteria bacterium]|nr:MAG: DNA gyrase subunit A [Alphaproteobacteria bacterium]